jgi:polyphosphate kinase 2 (PPK2 family)
MINRMQLDTIDSYDEELEQELDDNDLLEYTINPQANSARVKYFRELFRLQGELVKLQDWVMHKNLKVVVLFEGRDAAGKGANRFHFLRLSQLLFTARQRLFRFASCRDVDADTQPARPPKAP